MRTDRELESLLDRCRRGDSEAWGCLVDRFAALVYSVARRHGLAEDDAADVFQHTFQALHGSMNRLQCAATLPRWLAVTAGREALRLVRLRKKTSGQDLGSLEEVLASDERDAEAAAVDACRAELVRLAVAQLPGRCRELLTLLYFEEAQYQEVSERLSMPLGAIGPTRARCLEKTRRLLAQAGFFE